MCGIHRLAGPDHPLGVRSPANLGAALSAAGLGRVVMLMTDNSPNTFPGLPVREGERVLVWFAVLSDGVAADDVLTAARATPALGELFEAEIQLLRLQPTAGSSLHG